MNTKKLFGKAAAIIFAIAFFTSTFAQNYPALPSAPRVSSSRSAEMQIAANSKALAEIDAINAKNRAPRAPYPKEAVGFGYSSNQNYTQEENNFKNLDDVKSKEVSQEISTSKSPEIYIDNSSRGIVIKTWFQNKVKVTTTVYYEGEGKLTDEEWFEKLNVSLKMLGSSVKIKSGTISGGSYTMNGSTYGWSSTPSNGVAVFNGNGNNIGTKNNIKRIVTIYIPAQSRLDIESKYADVQITGAITNATIDLTNSNLDAENFNKLNLRSKYSNVSVDNVALAEIEFINGRLSAKNIDDADIDTKYSTVEMATVKKMIFRSTNDEYEIEEVQELRGRKNYGNLRISKLNSSLEVDGTNADIKVRNVGSNLSMVKIDNKYADIRLPIKSIQNYTVNYSGPYSNVYGNFEKQPLKEEPKSSDKNDDLAREIRSAIRSVERATGSESIENRFTAINGSGKGLKIDMKCQNCTVDFK
jgi:hypothetical protein